MPSLLTTAQIRELIPTDLSDAALVLLMDDAEAEIELRCGKTGENAQTETHRGEGSWLYLKRGVESESDIDSIEETTRQPSVIGTATVDVLAGNDWSLWYNGTALFREPNGDHPRTRGWGDVVVVTYTPAGGEAENSRRKRALVDLVRLSMPDPSKASENSGNYSVTHRDIERERARILRRLHSRAQRPLA